jgi:hypothetical protein
MMPSTAPAWVTALPAAQQVADAILYEGYLLYPYRASSAKNQVRWQFGVVGPVGAVEAMVGEQRSIFTECLVKQLGTAPRVDVRVRFLQTQFRAPEQWRGDEFVAVDELRVGVTNWISWHEAVEQELVLADLRVADLIDRYTADLVLAGGEEVEVVYNDDDSTAGRLVRTRYPLTGRVTVSATTDAADAQVLRLRIEVENTAVLADSDEPSRTARRDLAARQSFVSAHLLLTATDAAFVSMVDPPDWAADAASSCTNSRCWPFLAGVRGDDERMSDILLASPIIVGDYPEIAAESPGDLFDSAEIDEILTLRIMTMTDDEKSAARGTDPRAAAIIDRSDGMPPEVLERLHGAVRGLDPPVSPWAEPDFPSITTTFAPDGELTGFRETAPWFDEAADASVVPEAEMVIVGGVRVARDSRVRLRPSRRSDAHDMFLAGQIAVVRRVDRDVDGDTHVAVLLEDDPAADIHDWHGRYYYFGPEELEPLPAAAGDRSAR